MRTNQLQIRSNEYLDVGANAKAASPSIDHREILDFLISMSVDYPGICDWYLKKVVPGLRIGSRKVIQIRNDGKLVAIGIGKKIPSESKICTIRVCPEYAGRGFGGQLFEMLIEWLGVERPLITVAAEKSPCFAKIFKTYGFKLTSAQNGIYVPGKVELFYNEPAVLSRICWEMARPRKVLLSSLL